MAFVDDKDYKNIRQKSNYHNDVSGIGSIVSGAATIFSSAETASAQKAAAGDALQASEANVQGIEYQAGAGVQTANINAGVASQQIGLLAEIAIGAGVLIFVGIIAYVIIETRKK